MSLEQRMDDLEMRLAFQDDAMNTMSEELIQQQRIVERLQAQVAALVKRQEELMTQVGQGSAEETPPPHY
ncbi:SlyX family protein [Pseudomonas sp. Marseille-QA0892]